MQKHIQLFEPKTGKIAKYDSATILSRELPNPSSNKPLTRIEDAPLFCHLSTADCRSIVSTARERRFSSHQIIFCEGKAASGMSLLASGRVKLTRLSGTGVQLLLRVVENCEVVGQIGLSAGSRHTLSAKTMESCRVLTWEIQVFEALCERIPALAKNSLHIVANSQRALEERLLQMISEPAPARLARLLVSLLEKSSCSIHKPARIEGLLREELAQMVGVTIFTVSRLLCHWERLGIVKAQRQTIVVNNPRRLILFAEEIRNDQTSDACNFTLRAQATMPHLKTDVRPGIVC